MRMAGAEGSSEQTVPGQMASPRSTPDPEHLKGAPAGYLCLFHCPFPLSSSPLWLTLGEMATGAAWRRLSPRGSLWPGSPSLLACTVSAGVSFCLQQGREGRVSLLGSQAGNTREPELGLRCCLLPGGAGDGGRAGGLTAGAACGSAMMSIPSPERKGKLRYSAGGRGPSCH